MVFKVALDFADAFNSRRVESIAASESGFTPRFSIAARMAAALLLSLALA